LGREVAEAEREREREKRELMAERDRQREQGRERWTSIHRETDRLLGNNEGRGWLSGGVWCLQCGRSLF